MRRLLIAFLLVCWGPERYMCGEYIGRKELVAGGMFTINYYVVRLADGKIAYIEPDLITDSNIKPK